MGKKQFINKKKSATFTLVYRETATVDDGATAGRQFVRIDRGDNFVPGFSEDDPRLQTLEESDEEEDGNDGDDSRFDDADDESGGEGEEEVPHAVSAKETYAPRQKSLPEKVRRDLVELGFPDDGYDYNQHMRNIGPTATFVPSTRAAETLRPDIKAYDASKVEVQVVNESTEPTADEIINLVSSRTRPVRNFFNKTGVLDVDIVAALENSDGSQFESADELEDDFVVFANEGVEQRASGEVDAGTTSGFSWHGGTSQNRRLDEEIDELSDKEETDDDEDWELPGTDHIERPARLLDQRFETLALREYDDYDIGELDEDNPLARGRASISQYDDVLSKFMEDMDIHSEKYQAIAQLSENTTNVGNNKDSGSLSGKVNNVNMLVNRGMDDIVVKKTLELGANESEDEVVTLAESDKDSDEWDCETVVSTYSNLDNHPAKIKAPQLKAKLKDLDKAKIIRLGGKQHLPLDYLPRKPVEAKQVEKPVDKETTYFVKVAGPRAGETPEQRKARKASIKEQRREARVSKKALKLCYREDSHKAQHGAATMGPNSIHLP